MSTPSGAPGHSLPPSDMEGREGGAQGLRSLARFCVSSVPGNERRAIDLVSRSVRDLKMSGERLERLKTAVGEATMNAIEHGNRNRADLDVDIEVFVSASTVTVRITDHGGGPSIPIDPEVPDIEAKLAGEQSPRGWGLFLIRQMVDEMRIYGDETHHTVEFSVDLTAGRDDA